MRIFSAFTRPEPMLGTLQMLQTGRDRTAALGFINQGGTLNREDVYQSLYLGAGFSRNRLRVIDDSGRSVSGRKNSCNRR